MDNISSLRQITAPVASASVHLFEVAPAVRQFRGRRNWFDRNSRHVAKNPPRGVVIEYYLAQEPAGDVLLTIMDAGGKTIKQYSSSTKERRKPATRAGMNRFLWDMQYPGVKMPPLAGAETRRSGYGGDPAPPVAPPGRYTVRLTVDGQDYEQPFEIRMDPRMQATDADLRAQFEFMVDIQDRLSEVADAVMRIREVRGQLERKRAELTEDSRGEVDRILKQLREVEGVLMMWMGSPDHPMMWDGPGLIDKLSKLARVVGQNAKPTESMHTIFKQVSERFEIQRNRLNQIIEDEVKPLLGL